MTDATTTMIAFQDPARTTDGKRRASVPFTGLETLWFNTGTLCNLTCVNCYIESSPSNDRLVYLTHPEVASYLDEIEASGAPTRQIGFTGGEPFMNPAFMAMLEDVLERGFEALVLTNAMRPMLKCEAALERLCKRHGKRLEVRVSLDHHTRAGHERLRGARSWDRAIAGLGWLARQPCRLSLAGRTVYDEDDGDARAGYQALCDALGIPLDAQDHARLVLFPEMDEQQPVPEISTACWGILGRSPGEMMCATSRMVVRHRGEDHPVVVACTLLPYDERFRLGRNLSDARGTVAMNHPHCARFCALGGGACSAS